MKWIGLTGGLASGKSTVARLLRERGYPVIDADELARKVVASGTPGLQSVLNEFGSDLLVQGALDRRELGRRVFGKTDLLLKLEGILHPLIQAEMNQLRKAFASQGFRAAFYDVPLLFEKNITGFDSVLVVSAPDEQRRRWAHLRDGLSEGEIEARMQAQMPLADKVAKADDVIHNTGDLAFLETQVDDFLSKFRGGTP